mmetsp:Transcript_102544/g.289998  ORF Transcript_102544/g.289998 Transcript_102544/m.289998 type:complete len:414 (-) Transcript_102544:82-1323(-)
MMTAPPCGPFPVTMAPPPGIGAPAEGLPRPEAAACFRDAGRLDAGLRPRLDPALVEELRKLVLPGVDAKITERMSKAWERGSRAVQHMQKESEESFGALARSLADVKGAQGSLEADNAWLRQATAGLANVCSRVSGPCGPFGGPWAVGAGASAGSGWASSSTATTAATTPRQSEQPQMPQMFYARSGPLSPDSDSDSSPTAVEELQCAAGVCDRNMVKLADIPPFPLPVPWPVGPVLPPAALRPAPPATAASPSASPTALAAPVARVSLCDMLGFTAADEDANRAASSTASSMAAPAESEEEADAFVFALTLRLADGTDLGLTTSQGGRAQHLRIERVLAGGAAEAWNRQCGGTGATERLLLPGDSIVGVNSVAGDPQAMLRECSASRLLRLQVVRVGRGSSGPWAQAPARAR